MDIKGMTVRKVLIGAGGRHREGVLPLGRARPGRARRILLMGSSEGGVEIEQVADQRPAAIVGFTPIRTLGLQSMAARRLVFAWSSAPTSRRRWRSRRALSGR